MFFISLIILSHNIDLFYLFNQMATSNNKRCGAQQFFDHFPNDKLSKDLFPPILGLAISCISYGFISDAIIRSTSDYYLDYFVLELTTGGIRYGVHVILVATALQLFWGYHTDDRRMFAFWMIIKFCETVLMLWALIRQSIASISTGIIIIGMLCLTINFAALWMVATDYLHAILRTKNKTVHAINPVVEIKPNKRAEENIYEDPANFEANYANV